MSRITPAQSKSRRPIAALGMRLAALGVFAVILTPPAMLVTSTPEFCAYYHEMKPAYNEWLTSSHRVNKENTIVGCNDCHLPDSSSFVAFFLAKNYHGVKDLWGHFFGDEYDREKVKVRARTTIPDVRCQRCHTDLKSTCVTPVGMPGPGHRPVMSPISDGSGKSCIKCHENLVHKPQLSISKP